MLGKLFKKREDVTQKKFLDKHVGFSQISPARDLKMHFFMLFLSSVTGIVGAFAAIGFKYLIHFIQNLLMFKSASFGETSALDHSWGWLIIFVPVIGISLSTLIIRYLAIEAKGHGVPEIMEANLFKGGKMRKRLVFLKALASALTIGSGGSAGREGPIAQIGAAAGSTIGQWFKLNRDNLKILLACGTTAGIAATFNTPIAAVLFSLELIVFEFKVRSFIPLVAASVFATTISRMYWGNIASFSVPSYSMVDGRELLFYLGLGLICGLYGVGFIKLIYATEDYLLRWFRKFRWILPVFGGLAVGSIGYLYPQIFGVGYETVSSILQEAISVKLVAALILIKVVAVVITLGSGGSGGIFSPSLFMGAAIGGTYGYVIHAIFPGITATPGAYALVGMAAVFSGVSRATLTSMLILFEMTLDYNIIIPLMFACVVADAVSASLSKDTIYTKKIRRKGLDIDLDMEIDLMYTHRVEEIMTTVVGTLTAELTIKEALERFEHTYFHRFPIVDDKNQLIGIINSDELNDAREKHDETCKLKDIKGLRKEFTYRDSFIKGAYNKMMEKNLNSLPVVEGKSHNLIGVISRSDFFKINLLK